ncbi:hypothetical protein KSP39_PZI002173 [Platanthera zijinensis]|uniref:Uncharacterized protein n=1 Tax=Platanthera zijinensis TaxID=2320716 RepID=A0AAP0BXA3_9ASPA
MRAPCKSTQFLNDLHHDKNLEHVQINKERIFRLYGYCLFFIRNYYGREAHHHGQAKPAAAGRLYDMQFPLRPSWRPYEIDEKCKEVRIKPKLSHFEIEFSLDVDNTENYNKEVDDGLMIATQQCFYFIYSICMPLFPLAPQRPRTDSMNQPRIIFDRPSNACPSCDSDRTQFLLMLAYDFCTRESPPLNRNSSLITQEPLYSQLADIDVPMILFIDDPTILLIPDIVHVEVLFIVNPTNLCRSSYQVLELLPGLPVDTVVPIATTSDSQRRLVILSLTLLIYRTTIEP